MANPISEQVTLKIVERFKAITTTNGFSFTADVERYTPDLAKRGNRYRDNLLILVEGDEDLQESEPQGHDDWVKSYVVEYFIIASETSKSPIDTRLNKGAADIVWAITGDPTYVHSTGDPRQWDGLAINTMIGGTERFEFVDGSIHGIRVFFQVQYRVSETNPYTQT